MKLNSSLLSGTTYTDSTVTPGTAYTYTVRHVTAGSESADSTVLNATTAASFVVFTPLS